jgi:hypothetical protein
MANLSYKAQAVGLSLADALVQRGYLVTTTSLTGTSLVLAVAAPVGGHVCDITATSEVPAGTNVIGQPATGYTPTILTINFDDAPTLRDHASPVYAQTVLFGTKVILQVTGVTKGTFDNLQYPLLATI